MSKDTSSMMTGMPGGATSKGSADSKTAAAQRSIMRNASVKARCDLNGFDSSESASGGAYTRVTGEARLESAMSLYMRATSSADTAIVLGEPWVSNKFNAEGMKQGLVELEKGAQFAHTDRVQTEIKAALLSMDLSKPENQDYLKDKFRELGWDMGNDKGSDPLFAAIGNFLSDQPSFEKQVIAQAKGPVLRPN